MDNEIKGSDGFDDSVFDLDMDSEFDGMGLEDFDSFDNSAEEKEDDSADYSDGAEIDGDELLEDDSDILSEIGNDFINDSGSIVVQDNTDDTNGFEFKYIDIDKIAITKRIRKMGSVDGLLQSVQSTGLLEPIVVAPTATEDLYVLLHGSRRIQACARAGKKKLPCIVNNKVNTTEIPIIEAMYNHSRKYNIQEEIAYIDYLEKQQGILNPALIEFLLQLNSGDYTKLKDILEDNDPDIVEKLYSGLYDIATAFKKLEQRRKKETLEEREDKKAAKVYNDEQKSGVDRLEGSGEEADGEMLTEEQIAALSVNVEQLDDELETSSLAEMIDNDNDNEAFKPHRQKVGEREYIDPIVKKTVMARDNSTCQCCKRGGEHYVDILDYHHILPVFMGGADTPENGIMLCVSCHRLLHLYSTGDLHINKALLEDSYTALTDEQKERFENAEIFEDEKRRFKRIIKLGGVIREGIIAKGMNKEQYKKEHSNNGIGRRKPGVNGAQEIA